MLAGLAFRAFSGQLHLLMMSKAPQHDVAVDVVQQNKKASQNNTNSAQKRRRHGGYLGTQYLCGIEKGFMWAPIALTKCWQC